MTCEATLGDLDGFRCELQPGHFGAHFHQTEGARITWDDAVSFDKASPGDESYVWKPEPGTTEYAFWTDPEGVTADADDLVTVWKQRWRLIAEQEQTWIPHGQLCPACGGEGQALDGTKWEPPFHPDDGRCTICNATGEHPKAGTWTPTTTLHRTNVAHPGTVPHEQEQPPPHPHPHPTPQKEEP